MCTAAGLRLPMPSKVVIQFAALLTLTVQAQTLQPGDYFGTAQIGPTALRMALHLAPNADGTWGGTIDSLDQGALGIPIRNLTIDQRVVRFGNFEGTLNAGGNEIDGRLKQGNAAVPIVFRKVDKIEVLNRPQTPRKPYAYNEQDVEFDNEVAKVRLAGTFTWPKNYAAPVPAAVLINGSGPQDRDYTVFGHKPFLVLADDLTRRGFAVLRLDDRGAGKSSGQPGAATLEQLAQDIALAVEYLRTRKEVDSKAIGLIGHSEGGYIAPMAAVMNDAAFVILLAAPAVPGDELLYAQGQAVLNSINAAPNVRQRQSQLQKALFNAVLNEDEAAKLDARLRTAVAKFKATLTPEELAATPGFDQQMEMEIRRMLVPELQSLIRHDPAPVLKALNCPVLAIGGTLDTQVPAKQNLPAIAAALTTADYTIVNLPQLNHMLQTARTGSPNEFATIEETVSPLVLDTIGDWLVKRFIAPRVQ